MTLVKYEPKGVWDPFTDVWNFRDEMGRMFDALTGRPVERTVTRGWYPAVDVVEEKNHYLVKAELPGVKQEDIKVSIVDGTLTLKGERKAEHRENREGYQRLERAYGEFTRSFQLPSEVNADKINAKYKDGVLEIDIPKSEKAKPREISINIG